MRTNPAVKKFLCLVGLLMCLGGWLSPEAGAVTALDSMGIELATQDLTSGRLALERGDFDAAIKRLGQAIKSGQLTRANQAVAHNNRGNAWDAKGDSTRAIADYNRAIELDPKLAQAYFNRGIVRHRRGKFPEALADFEQFIRFMPDYAGGYYNQSFPLAALGRYDRAVASVEKAIKLSPYNQKYREQLEILKDERERVQKKKTD